MDLLGIIEQTLAEKKELFMHYEHLTGQMLDKNAEELAHYITERAQCATEIDKLDRQVEELCSQDEDEDLIRRAVHASCDFSELPTRMQGLFNYAKEIYAVMYRVREDEARVSEQMKATQEEALAQIRKSKNIPKIHRYLSGLASQQKSGVFLNSEDA